MEDPAAPPRFQRTVKSFVRRNSRITEHQTQALSGLYPRWGLPVENSPLGAQDLGAAPGQPLVLEIGFGMGAATLELAERHPETAYLGVEVFSPGVGKVLAEIAARGLTNLRVVQQDVHDLIPRLPLGRFQGIHIFFPDPWPKKRHHKRRLIQPPFTASLVPLLAPGGYVYAATDWEDYAVQILEVLSSTPGLQNPSGGYHPRVPWRPETKFERRGLEQQRLIREILVTKVPV